MGEERLYDVRGTDLEWKKKLLFAGVFIQENKLHAVYDRHNTMSCKQWLLMAVSTAFEEPPDLSSLAQAMGCSRQNVKKLALALEREGYITLEKSPKDGRMLCMKKTPKGLAFSQENRKIGAKVHEVLFQDFTEEEISAYYELSVKMMHSIDQLDEFFREKANQKENISGGTQK